MTDAMAYRGPDAQEIWTDGHVGLGHAMLRTTAESKCERQPCSLDVRVWIVADARLDDRDELRKKLESEGRTGTRESTDAQLILHAYHTWREDLFEHLLGDFAFAIWDGRRQRLLCARDHFGIKPFYYVLMEGGLVFSNTLNCLRIHPDVSDRINELAIGDFLLFGFNQRLDMSAYDNVLKLPPAHALTWSPGSQPQRRRYWSLAVAETVRYGKDRDYVDRFLELLRQAVSDRLRTERAGVFMSGGLDSTSVAWMASEIASSRSETLDLRAFTLVYDRLIPDEERHYSSLVAAALGIPIHHLTLDEDRAEDFWYGRGSCLPEPADLPVTQRIRDILCGIAPDFRVGLTGQGGDPTLHLSPHDYLAHVRQVRLLPASLEIWRYIRCHGQFPRAGIRTAIKRRFRRARRDQRPIYPPWLDRGFEERCDLPARWRELMKQPEPNGASRPDAHRDLVSPMWVHEFQSYDPGITGVPCELRHPYLDLRVVEYLLAIPPVPWCVEKELLRVAMRGRLPEPVWSRRKAPLAGYPIYEQLLRDPPNGFDMVAATSELDRFVDVHKFVRLASQPAKLRPSEYELITRPLGLACWLRQACRV